MKKKNSDFLALQLMRAYLNNGFSRGRSHVLVQGGTFKNLYRLYEEIFCPKYMSSHRYEKKKFVVASSKLRMLSKSLKFLHGMVKPEKGHTVCTEDHIFRVFTRQVRLHKVGV